MGKQVGGVDRGHGCRGRVVGEVDEAGGQFRVGHRDPAPCGVGAGRRLEVRSQRGGFLHLDRAEAGAPGVHRDRGARGNLTRPGDTCGYLRPIGAGRDVAEDGAAQRVGGIRERAGPAERDAHPRQRVAVTIGEQNGSRTAGGAERARRGGEQRGLLGRRLLSVGRRRHGRADFHVLGLRVVVGAGDDAAGVVDPLGLRRDRVVHGAHPNRARLVVVRQRGYRLGTQALDVLLCKRGVLGAALVPRPSVLRARQSAQHGEGRDPEHQGPDHHLDEQGALLRRETWPLMAGRGNHEALSLLGHRFGRLPPLSARSQAGRVARAASRLPGRMFESRP
jgi:hypothetical protein